MGKFIASLFDILLSCFDFVLQSGADFTVSAMPSTRRIRYNAEFGHAHEVFSKNAGGFTICNQYGLTPRASYEHVLTAAATGAGKTSAVTIPSCLQLENASQVITDNAGDLYQLTAAFIKQGYKIKVINLDNPEQSDGFNALSKCRTDSDFSKVSNALVRNSMPADADDFWSKSTEQIITFFGKYLYRYESSENCTLSNVLELINVFSYDPERIDHIVANTDPSFLNEYKAIAAIPDKTLASILATAKAALAIYGTDNIRKICSFDTIDFDSFRKERTVLILRTNAADAHLYRGITATFFELFFSHILRTDLAENDLSIFFTIEEAGSVYLGTLGAAISLIRKKNCGISLFFQDLSQVRQLYQDQSTNIISNCGTKVFLPGSKSLETCEMIEKMIGKFQFDDEGTIRTRELLTAQEIRQLDQVLVLHGTKSPILLPLVPWFKSPKLRRLMDGDEYKAPNRLPFQQPPIIKI